MLFFEIGNKDNLFEYGEETEFEIRKAKGEFKGKLFYNFNKWKADVEKDKEYQKLKAVNSLLWSEKLSYEFREKVFEVAEKLEMDPNHLLLVMNLESAGTWDPGVQNPNTNATGLIQIMPFNVGWLGTTIEELKNMSQVEQMDYVYKYLKRHKGKMTDLTKAYLAVFSPAYMNKDPNFVLYETPSNAYELNKGLDVNKNGKIEKSEIIQKFRIRNPEQMKQIGLY